MTPPGPVRVEPMDEATFREFVERSVPRRAAKWVERGIWAADDALKESLQVYARRLPQGRETPGCHFFTVVDTLHGTRVGEGWYSAKVEGGKLQVWVEWILIEPEQRRKGYATLVLRQIEEEARKRGADRIGLTVWTDNASAMALYAKLGYTPANVNMTKSLAARE